jgi:hypothetical protein
LLPHRVSPNAAGLVHFASFGDIPDNFEEWFVASR